MFCEKCGSPMGEGASFCSVCGAMATRVAPPSQQPVQPAYPPYNDYQQTYYAQPPAAPQYAPAPPVQQYAPARHASAPKRQPAVSKGGYIAMIILSSLAMGLCLLYLIASVIEYYYGVSFIIGLIEFLICIVPFFVFALMARKVPGVLLAIPLLILATANMIVLFLYGGYYNVLNIIAYVVFFSGAVMFLVTMLIKSRPMVMRIITAALLGTYAIYLLIYRFLFGIEFYWFGILYYCGDIAFVCVLAAAIVYLFSSKAPARIENRHY